MVIDFHTHIFPDQIAAKAIKKLEASADEMKAYTDGTFDGLTRSMQDSKIDISVILPVATSPKQFDTLNNFAKEVNSTNHFYSFGGIHPDNENPEEKLEFIKSQGLLGIKLHPDYQNTFIDDPKYIRIINYAIKLGLYVTFHCGLDPAFPHEVKATPERILKMLSQTDYENRDTRIILAHMGSLDDHEGVKKLLLGRNVYLDTAVMFDRMDTQTMVDFIKTHGSEKILFGTDSPWAEQKGHCEKALALPLPQASIDNIMYKNAKRILNL